MIASSLSGRRASKLYGHAVSHVFHLKVLCIPLVRVLLFQIILESRLGLHQTRKNNVARRANFRHVAEFVCSSLVAVVHRVGVIASKELVEAGNFDASLAT